MDLDMDMEETRIKYCVGNVSVGPQPILVCEVIGSDDKQISFDICLRVPRRKPAIEQVVDVYVKNVRITSVNIIPDKVVVRGRFDVKAIYVACRPNQPVHAVEDRNIRFTADIHIPGARRDMEAEAQVRVEYVDYDCDENTRAHWHKNNPGCDYDDEDDCDCKPKKKKHESCDCECDDECDHDCADECDYDDDDCDEECKPPKKHKKHKKHKHHHDDCGCNHHHHDDCNCHHHHHHHCDDKCTRKCNVSVVLRVSAKVITTREMMIEKYGSLPHKPKG